MMTDPVEAAARAAYESCREWGGCEQPWDEISPYQSDTCQEHWRVMARSAIRAYLLAEAARKNSGQRNFKDQWEAGILTRLATSLTAA